MDDGTVARLGDELFYVTTTSTGSDGVFEWFEWWNAVWGYDVEIVNVTGALAARQPRRARRRARRSRALTDADVSNEALPLPRRAGARGRRRAVPRAPDRLRRRARLRAPLPGEHRRAPLGRARRAAGAVPFGLEPQRMLRLEKAHVIVGQDTDSESNLLSAGMPWIVKLDKDDFVGKWAAEHVQERGVRERLVGFTMPAGVAAARRARRSSPAGARPAASRAPARASGSARRSASPGSRPSSPRRARRSRSGSTARSHARPVTLAPFYDPTGERLPVVSAARLPLARRRRRRAWRSSRRSGTSLGDGVVDVSQPRQARGARPARRASSPRPGEELLPLTPGPRAARHRRLARGGARAPRAARASASTT